VRKTSNWRFSLMGFSQATLFPATNAHSSYPTARP
jgi:hypothetical protein